MTNERHEYPVQSHLLWQQAWLSIWGQRKRVCLILILFFILPQLISECLLGAVFKGRYDELLTMAQTDTLNILQLLSALREGAFLTLATLSLTLIFLTVGYICLLRTSISYFQSKPVKNLLAEVGDALRILPGTFFLLIFLLLFFGAMQATLPFLVLIAVPLTMAPTIKIIENSGFLPSLRKAATLRFIGNSGVPKISVYFILLGYLGFIILSLYAALLIGDLILGMDTIFPGTFLLANSQLGGMPFSAVYLLFEVLFILITSLATTYFVSLTASFYFYLKNRNQRLPSEGIQA